MFIFKIEKYPEKILRKKCLPIESVTEKEKDIFQKMLHTMHHFKGIGLAAPQVGIARKIIVADIGEGAVILVNPQVIKRKGNDELEEGCLSIPQAQVNVLRSYKIMVKGLNEKGESQEINAKGLLARVLQHEIDHLEGKLIIDYLFLWKRINFEINRKR
ncbi:MAG: peptide deformylase [Candidatus Omnitrophica bacterium]|nr:peptide deformylase [Candidatus Omnitrophota bacterium]